MKRSDLIFTAILLPVDFLMLVLAGLVAYFLRTSQLISQWRPVLFNINLPFERYFELTLMVSLFWLVIFALAGLYKIKRTNKTVEEFFQIVIASSAGLMAVIIYIFIKREWFDSRFIILVAWSLAIIFVFLGRILIRKLQQYSIIKYGLGVEKLVIIGSDKVTKNLIQEIENLPELGFKIMVQIPSLDIPSIKEAVENSEIDQILLGNINYPNEKILELIDFCQEKRIDFKFIPNLFQTLTANLEIETLLAAPIIELKRTALDGWGKIIKRLIDIFGSIFCLIIFMPLMAIIALVIKLDSFGPVIYKNERVGPKDNFKLFKFRTMYLKYCTGQGYSYHQQATIYEDKLAQEQSLRRGPVFKIINDPRRTKVGRFLERTSLDELPQFFNVLKGEMSLVGPRPHMPKEVVRYKKHHYQVFNIKSGITGPAQISGRSDIDFDEEVKLDAYYIEHWSLKLDLKILLKTPFVVLFRRHKS